MPVEFFPTRIAGCWLIQTPGQEDQRGSFTKNFQASQFAQFGCETGFREQYVTVSKKNVLRGMHFQLPPHDHAKLVTCLVGDVLDVVVDLREGSETFGEHLKFELSPGKENQVYIPSGLAHGFYVRSESATLLYNVTTEYAPEHDAGIRWDSCGIIWPNPNTILSPRDQKLVPFSDFLTPFRQTA